MSAADMIHTTTSPWIDASKRRKIDSPELPEDLRLVDASLREIRQYNDHSMHVRQLNPLVQSLLKSAVPHEASGSVSFMAYRNWYGTAHEELSKLILRDCFARDVQQRRIIGIVQSYGCGKTKTVLMLTRLGTPFIVLPWRPGTREVLFEFLTTSQSEMLPDESANMKAIEDFMKACQRLISLVFLAHLHVLEECISSNILDIDDPDDRFYFALLLLQRSKGLATLLLDWCQRNKHTVKDPTAFEALRTAVLQKRQKYRVVFLLDEIHIFFGACRGYCLHAELPSRTQTVTDWRNEQEHMTAAPGHSACTDLFYQIRLFMLETLEEGTPFAFVMCSTLFNTWKQLEEENSPLSRETITKFYRMHSFSALDAKRAIQDLFNIPDTIFTPDIMKQLLYWDRPYSLIQDLLSCLVENLRELMGSDDETLRNWILKGMESSLKQCRSLAKDKVDKLVSINPSVEDVAAKRIFRLLYTSLRVCGGTLNLGGEDDGVYLVSKIIQNGVARLERNDTRLRVADQIFIDTLLNKVDLSRKGNDCDPVLATLAEHKCTHEALISQDTSSNGFMAERTFAWLVLQNKLNCLGKVKADTAGTREELRLQAYSDAQLLIDVAKGVVSAVVLPSKAAGPDLWFQFHKEPRSVVVGMQLKLENVVFGRKKFIDCLQSLNPVKMFSSAGQAEKATWQGFLKEFESLPYQRVVFSGAGFSSKVHYLAKEYNQTSLNKITLLSLESIEKLLGPVAPIWKRTITKQADVNHPILLQSEWNAKTLSQKEKHTVAQLSSFCEYRGIATAKRKKKEYLINELDAFQPHLLLEKLKPKFQ